MEKNPGMFIKNFHFFSTDERKTWTSWMTAKVFKKSELLL